MYRSALQRIIFCSLIVGLPGVATLGGLSALSGASPPTAYALPARPPDPSDPPDTPGPPGHDTCAPQQVTGAQATLEGFMFVPDTPMVGQPTRIRISNPKIVLPDPTCDERTIGVAPTSHAWAVGTRPAGSTAIPTDLGADARLVTDRPGQWEVWYIACPNTCLIAGVVVPAQSRSVAFSPILVAEGRVSSADLLSSLQVLLAGSRLQISHTGNGTPAAGPPTTYTVRWSVPAYKYHDLCDPPPNAPANWEPAPICSKWDGEGRHGEVTLHTRTPLLTSYFDFGPVAEQVGAPDVLALPIQAVEREVPLEKRALTLALQGGLGALLGVDVDQIRLLANNLHLNLNDGQRWSTSIGNGGINLNLSLQSSQPSVVCEGHFKLKVGYVLTLADGWADEFCPDFDLSQMDLSVRLVPTVVDGALTVGDAQVTVQLEPVGAQSELIDFFVGATTIGENRIATTIRTKLLEEKTKVALGKLLTKALQHKFPDMCRVVSAQVSGSDLVIQYQAPLRPGLPCPGSSSGNAPPF